MIRTEHIQAEGIRFSIEHEGREIARAYLYLIRNGLHVEPYAFLEDIFVEKEFRSLRAGSDLLAAAVEVARERGCYKLVATSRNDGTRADVHAWYLRLGFRAHGTEFRMDL